MNDFKILFINTLAFIMLLSLSLRGQSKDEQIAEIRQTY